MDQFTNKQSKELVTFKTKVKVTEKIHGKSNFDMRTKKMIDLYNEKLNTSAS